MEKSFNPKGVKKKKLISMKMMFLVIVPILLIVLLILGGRRLSWREVKADQVVVIINNITGGIKVIDRAGAVIYYPFIQDLYILDKAEQIDSFSTVNISPENPEGNPMVLMTVDGGEASLDIIFQYKIIPKIADKIVRYLGTDYGFKDIWLDHAKTIVRYNIGELTLEELPFAVKRAEMEQKTKEELNELFKHEWIVVTSVNFINYRYYREYDIVLEECSLAITEVTEQIHRARAARKNKERVIVDETKKLEVAVSRFKGEVYEREKNAEAEAEKIRDEAVAHLLKAQHDGDAEYERLKKEAASILAVKKAEAAGVLALKKALEGVGGRNLVKMEYAKRLLKATITGTPVLRSNIEIPQLRIREIEREVKEVEKMPVEPMMPEPTYGEHHGGHHEEAEEQH